MTTISIEEAQRKLVEIIDQLRGGQTVAITDRGRIVAQLQAPPERSAADGPWPSQAGSGRTPGFWMAPDFDEPLEEFREFTE